MMTLTLTLDFSIVFVDSENSLTRKVGGRHPAYTSSITKPRGRHPLLPSVIAPERQIRLHILSGATSYNIRCASTTSAAVSLPTDSPSVVSSDNQEDPDSTEETFTSTKTFLSQLSVHDRRRVTGTIRKVEKNTEHIKKMILPGFRREIFRVIQRGYHPSDWPASAFSRRKLSAAMRRRAERRVGHFDTAILPSLRREFYSAITGIDALALVEFNPNMEKLNELVAKRQNGTLAEELPLEKESVEGLRRSVAWRRKNEALKDWAKLKVKEMDAKAVDNKNNNGKCEDDSEPLEQSQTAAIRELALSDNIMEINGLNWAFNNARTSNDRSSLSSTSPNTPTQAPSHLPHLTSDGSAHMVNVKDKKPTHRVAVATGSVVFTLPETHKLISASLVKKGDVLGTARVAGIMAAKICPALVPLCHPIALSSVEVDVNLLPPKSGTAKRQQFDGPIDLVHSKLLRFHQSQTHRIGATRKEIVEIKERLRVVERAVNTYIDEINKNCETELPELIEPEASGDPEKGRDTKRIQKFNKIREASYVVQRICKSLDEAAERAMKELASGREINEEFKAKINEAVKQIKNLSLTPKRDSSGSEKNAQDHGSVRIEAKVECTGPTGVEMEALTSVTAAALTVIDMIKAVDRNARIEGVKMVMKRGGRSGWHVDETWLTDPHRVYEVK